VEPYLPFSADKLAELGADAAPEAQDYILEPDAQALVDQLLPQVMMLKFHAAILDSAAAEQAARTIAMQTATDNAEELYENDRLLAVLNRDYGTGAEACEAMCRAVKEDIDRFVGDAPQFDDITMLCLYYAGKNDEQNDG
jgi:hypothetical protein